MNQTSTKHTTKQRKLSKQQKAAAICMTFCSYYYADMQ